MNQIVGTSKKHTFKAYDTLGAEVTTLTDPVVKYRIDGGDKTTLSTPTISAYDSDMRDFLITVPDTLAANPYVTISLSITATEGAADILIDVFPLLTLAAINAEVDTALSDFDTATPIAKTSELSGYNTENVIPRGYYALDVTAKTITLSSPYNTLTVEQILRIKDLTTNYIIYDCEDSKYSTLPISITSGVLTYTAPARDAADNDALQIFFNAELA